MLAPALVDVLACPKCKGQLVQREGGFGCHGCRLFFAVDEGIPNFLVADARPFEPEASEAGPRA